MHPLGPKLLPGIFIGYYLRPGGRYDGDMFIADWDDIKSSQNVIEIPVRRIKSAEIKPRYSNGKFMFPLAEGRLFQPSSQSFGPHQRNRQPRCVAWKDDVTDEDIQERLNDDDEPKNFNDDDDTFDEVANLLGGRVNVNEVPQEYSDPIDYWTLTTDVLIIHHLRPRHECTYHRNGLYQFL